jgi:hypothetical protein
MPEADRSVAVLSYDEKPGIQAIATTAPDLTPGGGTDAQVRARDVGFDRRQFDAVIDRLRRLSAVCKRCRAVRARIHKRLDHSVGVSAKGSPMPGRLLRCRFFDGGNAGLAAFDGGADEFCGVLGGLPKSFSRASRSAILASAA